MRWLSVNISSLKDQKDIVYFKSCHGKRIDIALFGECERFVSIHFVLAKIHDLWCSPSASSHHLDRCVLGRFDDERQSIIANAKIFISIDQYVGLPKPIKCRNKNDKGWGNVHHIDCRV